MILHLNRMERLILFKQDPATKKRGGFQSLLVGLQNKLDAATSLIDITPIELERISRYAFDYRNGGWEDRLIAIFSRTLGSRLGR